MQFESFVEAHQALLLGVFLIALVMGAVVNPTAMGAVRERYRSSCAPGCSSHRGGGAGRERPGIW